jgi:hypothetical protein
MGKLVQIKTKPSDSNVVEFINSITDEQKREDSLVLLSIMEKRTKEKPRLWGSSIIGFGSHRYRSPATGREVDWFKIGFSPRKSSLSLHLLVDFKKQSALLQKLGKHKTGVGCLYINKLADVDQTILDKLIAAAVS